MNITVDINNIDDLFPSTYMNASDFITPRTFIIESVQLEDMVGKRSQLSVFLENRNIWCSIRQMRKAG